MPINKTWLDRASRASLNIRWRRRLHNDCEEKPMHSKVHAVEIVPSVLRRRTPTAACPLLLGEDSKKRTLTRRLDSRCHSARPVLLALGHVKQSTRRRAMHTNSAAHPAGTKGEERQATFFVRFSCIRCKSTTTRIDCGGEQNSEKPARTPSTWPFGRVGLRADDTSSYMHVAGGTEEIPSHKGKEATPPTQQASVG